jgi:DNA-binding NtrC family response regulator
MDKDKRMLIYIVDNDADHAQQINNHLNKFKDFEYKNFTSGQDCLNHLDNDPDIIIVDYPAGATREDTERGSNLLREIVSKKPETDVVIISPTDSNDHALEMVKYGASDYVVRNESEFVRLENTLYSIIRKRKLLKELKSYKTATIILGILLIIAAIGLVVMFQTGMLYINQAVLDARAPATTITFNN